jgi:putative nucleotidyltransferase with HDIG domain
MKVIYLFGGLPGSGKSEAAWDMGIKAGASFAADNFWGGEPFSREGLGVAHERCQGAVEHAMTMGTSPLVVHNTFSQMWERKAYQDMAVAFGYRVHDMVVLNTHGGESTAEGMTEEIIARMEARFEVPLRVSDARPPGRGRTLPQIIEALKDVPQTPVWHPEGNVYTHTAIVVDRALDLYNDKVAPVELVWAALFHDLGKIEKTQWSVEKMAVTSHGHADKSVEYVDHFRDLIPPHVNRDLVRYLVAEHMNVKFASKRGEKSRTMYMTHPDYPVLELFIPIDDMVGITFHADRSIEVFEHWLENEGLVSRDENVAA